VVRALVIVHDEREVTGPLGVVGDLIAERADVDVRHVAAPLPDPADVDLVVCYGAAASAHDDRVAWLGDELDYLRAASAQTALLGICFGSQVIARALGGTALRAPEAEIGWHPVVSAAPDLIDPGPWFQYHGDTFTVPPGATELARSPVGPQAYRTGRTLAVQFHPEITPDVFAQWEALEGPDGLRADLARHDLDRDEVVAEIAARAPLGRARTTALVDRFFTGFVAAGR
jgi:GMP synthase (glutamine-hydrolysing)